MIRLPSRCLDCGVPLDALPFDDASVRETPTQRGESVVLAQFKLPHQYCGVLTYFAQFADTHANDPAQIQTSGLRWTVAFNGQPAYPYSNLDVIVNPWGYGSFPTVVRIEAGATVTLSVRREDDTDVLRVGGRIAGRYWFDPAYGGQGRGPC